MPSKTAKQARTMAAAAHNPAFAKKVGIPVSVAKEFNKADKGKKFKEGGIMKETMKTATKGASKMGSVRTAAPSKDGIAAKGKTKGKMVTMCSGGKAKK